MRDIFAEIFATAKRNKLRTALTGFSVAWGIFMIIFLLGAGNGLINAQMQQTSRFFSNSMMVGGSTTTKAHNGLKEGREIVLNDRDISTTSKEFGKVIDKVVASIEQSGNIVSRGANYVSTQMEGVYPDDELIDKKEMLCGRFINDIDLQERRKVIVLSNDDAKELWSGDLTNFIGEYVNVGKMAFRVVGIYKADKSGRNVRIYTPFTTFRTIYNKGDKADIIVFSFHGLKTEKENEDFEKQYKARINSNHNAAPDDEGAIWIWNRFTQSMQMDKGISIIHTALWVIGLFTLLSGIVGVSNIMLITVKERTREFGIRKAIGATPWAILKLIIIESVIITMFFGYLGMLLGVAANEYMDATIGHTTVNSGVFEATMFLNPTVGIDVCIEATLLMVIAGTIAGLIPARKAARIRPIEALKAE
ncbi:MAG: ABC transporter permease [Prevotella sp.]|uniref:ABC transporter permease n=1 Tax=Prevotella sp. TaxID=59823 RepID=UPI002A29AFFC|nr:ABC transporter permease [Prevotella sp.]MDD7318092.1 ABC transporter permease [Prevotellaceae bacterium]MDY4021019.1 ABC transporter permease [Prevotella sp.]